MSTLLTIPERFLLDSNIFIQASLQEYQFSFCQLFWDSLIELHEAGLVFSINAVKDELSKKNDEVKIWVDSLPNSFFIDHTTSQQEYGKLINWAYANPTFSSEAKVKFASEHADPWLVATAASEKMTIITHETYSEGAKNRIKIPNAARFLNVPYCRLYDFLKNRCENNFSLK